MTRILNSAVMAAGLLLLGPMAQTPALAGDKEDIVARWDHPYTDGSYIRFYNDVTFKWVALLNTTEGKYRFLEAGVMEFDTPGVIYGRNVTEVKYRLKGDALELKLLGSWVKYSKVK